MTTVVVGATGVLGGAIARRLLAAGEEVRVLVRPSSDYRALQEAGAELRFGDLKEPTRFGDALQGAARVVTTANTAKRGGDDSVEAVDLHGNLALVEAARRAGAERFVFVSASIADPDSPVPFLAAKGKTEEALRSSGMSYTILRPVPFMEDWIGYLIGAQVARAGSVTLVGDGTAPRPFVALQNVAELAVAALGDPGARDEVIVLSGDAASYREIVDLYGRALGRELEVRTVAPGEPVPGIDEGMAGLWAAMEAAPGSDLVTAEIAERYGVGLLSIEAFVRSQVATMTA